MNFLKAISLILCVVISNGLLINAAHAKDYQVEVIIFTNPADAQAFDNAYYTPPKAMSSLTKAWYLEPSLLTDSALRIKNSSNYKLIKHFSWGQQALPLQKAASVQLLDGELVGLQPIDTLSDVQANDNIAATPNAVAMPNEVVQLEEELNELSSLNTEPKDTLSGWIKVYATNQLFINVDLDVNGYRLSEKRRLKLNERHFFDHPKFGVLVQVSRLQTIPKEPSVLGQ